MQYLSAAWLDECRRLWAAQPERIGASARIQYVIEDPPGHEDSGDDDAVCYYQIFTDGRITDSALGTLPDPQVTLTLAYRDSVAVVRGDLDPNLAYGRGQIRFAGDMRTLMGMFPILWPSPTSRASSPTRYRALQHDIRQATEFSDL